MDSEDKFFLGAVLAIALIAIAGMGTWAWSKHADEVTRRACLDHHTPVECSALAH